MANITKTSKTLLTGIRPDSYDGVVCYRLYEGTVPDEIIVVQAWDNETVEGTQELLEKRLHYKRESGEHYLTEYQPMLQARVVRRDGLTVSLIASEQAGHLAQVMDGLR